ncbi:MAG: hypothetical protein RID07_09020, partial [Lacipirellulaceae bacterium]
QAINDALRKGSSDAGLIGRVFRGTEGGSPFGADVQRMPSLAQLNQQVKQLTRQRGRVWRGVRPQGGLNQGTIQVAIPQPSPHGLPPEAIVYAFEIGLANGPNPQEGAQYLGQFKVESVSAEGAVLSPIQQLDGRTGPRLEQSQGPWSIYETMPDDRHELYAELPPEQKEQILRRLLPGETVEEYLRHGGPATADDDEFHVAGYDEDGKRVPPDETDNAAEKRYDRPLRSYAYLFDELNREKVVMLADQVALQRDIELVTQAQESAAKLESYRKAEKAKLAQDKKLMIRDREAIEALSQTLTNMVENASGLLKQALDANAQLADQLMLRQVGRIETSTR